MVLLYSSSSLERPLFKVFTNDDLFSCRMGSIGLVILKFCVDVEYIIVYYVCLIWNVIINRPCNYI